MTVTIHVGDALSVLRTLPSESVQCVITSPPYFSLRDYGTASWEGGDPACSHQHETQHQMQGATSIRTGRRNVEAQRNENIRGVCPCGAIRNDQQIGLEPTPAEFIAALMAVFDEVRRVLRRDGTCWVNLGDSMSHSGKGPTGHNGLQNAETRQGFEAGYIMANGQRSRGGRKSKTAGTPSGEFELRDDLTPEQVAYVLRELAACKSL